MLHSSKMSFLQNAIILGTLAFSLVAGNEFSYKGSEGPSFWGGKYKNCIGKHQSPINIQEHDVDTVHLPPIIFEKFDAFPQKAEITNNGHTAVITLKPQDQETMPTISGGPLAGRYQFSQMHFHWGVNDFEGSENLINNNSFAMELHMVFFQQGYGNFSQAIRHPDGLTVLSFLYACTEIPNKNYDPIINALPVLENVHSSASIKAMPSLDALITANRSVYFTYGGSLTTPPCSEIVTWIEFKNTVPFAHSQIDAFRHLKDALGRPMSHNFRPTQPLHGRLIRMVHDDKRLIYDYHNAEWTNNNRAVGGHSNWKYLAQILTVLLIILYC